MTPPVSAAEAIQRIGRPVFTTREVAYVRRASLSGTNQALTRMAQRGLIAKAARGVWCVPTDPRFSRFALTPSLVGRDRSYVSLLSALHLHGMIDQVPHMVYAATTAHTRTVHTPLGGYSFHRIHPRFFAGFDWYGDRQRFLIAGREKALIDCLYLAGRRGRRFGFLPEIDLGPPFAIARAREWVARIPDSRLRAHVAVRLDALWRRHQPERAARPRGRKAMRVRPTLSP